MMNNTESQLTICTPFPLGQESKGEIRHHMLFLFSYQFLLLKSRRFEWFEMLFTNSKEENYFPLNFSNRVNDTAIYV